MPPFAAASLSLPELPRNTCVSLPAAASLLLPEFPRSTCMPPPFRREPEALSQTASQSLWLSRCCRMHFVHHRHVVKSTLCGQLLVSSFGPAWPPWCMSPYGPVYGETANGSLNVPDGVSEGGRAFRRPKMHFVHHRHVVKSTLCGQLSVSSFGPAWPPRCMSPYGPGRPSPRFKGVPNIPNWCVA